MDDKGESIKIQPIENCGLRAYITNYKFLWICDSSLQNYRLRKILDFILKHKKAVFVIILEILNDTFCLRRFLGIQTALVPTHLPTLVLPQASYSFPQGPSVH